MADKSKSKSILCLTSYEKGFEFLRECRRQGYSVMLLTGESLRHSPWPMDAIDDIFFLPDPNKEWNLRDMVKAVSYLSRSVKIDRIVALDDFDVEKAALLREHLRIPGMGETTARNFRDKLAMRGRAKDAGIPVPPFSAVFNDGEVNAFAQSVPAPWVIKPRLQANAIGIKKVGNIDELWHVLHSLGDTRDEFLIEKYIPGKICHVDSVIVEGKVTFACASEYGTPPMEVFHGGRVFTTRTVMPASELETNLLAVNQKIMTGLGLKYGVSHTEFIVGDDGVVYFLETSARVGGANIAELVEFSTGVNLWVEWAKLECAENPKKVKTKRTAKNHGALLATLAQQTHPDMSRYNDPEVKWKLDKKQHAGLILASPDYDRTTELLDSYLKRFYQDFFASLPAAESASQMG
ncbi:MAG: ATP-grasp domain-containing protein [Armatimonadetes bacterium]|nr:ATP-grasp domain-containing protein [Armatimonadota bacterium]